MKKNEKKTWHTDLDPEKLKVSQDFVELVGVKKRITTIPVRRPHRQNFIRVHSGESYTLQAVTLENREDREIYIVDPGLCDQLQVEIVRKVLYTAVSRHGDVFLWPIRLPDSDGRHDPWNRSALDLADTAKDTWIRVVANRSLGAYEAYEATGKIPEPAWPDLTFREILNIAFRDKFIDSLDHLVLRSLRGEI